jgi:hypothetical protein
LNRTGPPTEISNGIGNPTVRSNGGIGKLTVMSNRVGKARVIGKRIGRLPPPAEGREVIRIPDIHGLETVRWKMRGRGEQARAIGRLGIVHLDRMRIRRKRAAAAAAATIAAATTAAAKTEPTIVTVTKKVPRTASRPPVPNRMRMDRTLTFLPPTMRSRPSFANSYREDSTAVLGSIMKMSSENMSRRTEMTTTG